MGASYEGGMGQASGGGNELLGTEELAARLGVSKVTVWRWCREERLPCLKVGKAWLIRRAALEDFLLQRERPTTLAGQLRSFLTVPDNVIAVAQSPEMLHRLDAAFLRVGEARGGIMVKFHRHDPESLGGLRDEFERAGLEARRLEGEGRLYFRSEPDPPSDRAESLRRFLDEEASEAGRTVWATFNWAERLAPGAALAHQEALAELVEERRLVVRTAVLEDVMDQWPPELRRRAQTLHSGVVWLSEAGLTLSRVTPSPPD